MSANKKVIPVLAKNMAQALYYRRHLKTSDPEVDILRIVSLHQLKGMQYKEIHLLPDWTETFRGDSRELLEFCVNANIQVIGIDGV